jgi:hypothetical protein
VSRLPWLILLLLLSTGCVPLAPFKPGQPVEVEPAFFGHDYKQGGEPLKRSGLVDGLDTVEAARADVKASQSAYWAGALLVPPGTIAVGLGAVGVAQGAQQGWAVLGLGGALLGLSMWSAAVADRHLEAAVGVYNAKLPPPPEVAVAPFAARVAPPAGRGSGGGVESGLVLRFWPMVPPPPTARAQPGDSVVCQVCGRGVHATVQPLMEETPDPWRGSTEAGSGRIGSRSPLQSRPGPRPATAPAPDRPPAVRGQSGGAGSGP